MCHQIANTVRAKYVFESGTEPSENVEDENVGKKEKEHERTGNKGRDEEVARHKQIIDATSAWHGAPGRNISRTNFQTIDLFIFIFISPQVILLYRFCAKINQHKQERCSNTEGIRIY